MTTEREPLLRLNLGCGNKATPGWVGIDRSPNLILSRYPRLKRALRLVRILEDAHMNSWDREIQRADIRSLPYPSNCADAIYSSHALEHIYLGEAKQVIAEAERVLRRGGVLRLALPDAVAIARRLLEHADEPDAGRRFNDDLLAFPEMPTRGLRALIGKTGGHVHRWQPTASMVKQMMLDAGLKDVRDCAYKVGMLPDLDAIETRPESFFVEGIKA